MPPIIAPVTAKPLHAYSSGASMRYTFFARAIIYRSTKVFNVASSFPS